MNQKLKKFLKRTAIITTGVVAFGGTLVGGYLLAPNRTKYINIAVKEREKTPFEKFVERVTRDVGLSESEGTAANYLSATFDNFNVEYTVEGSSKVNRISVDGGVDFRMSAISLSGIEFNVEADIDYNGRQLPITLGHFKNDIYFGLKDLKIKFSEFSEQSLIDRYWYSFGYYANLDFPELLGSLGDLIGDKLGGLIDGLLNGTPEPTVSEPNEQNKEGGLDVSSLLANGPKEEHATNQWTFTLGEEGSDLCIKLITDDEFALKRVDLGTISLGGVSISGAINVDLKPYDQFVSPASGNDYVEVFNYSGLTQKLISLFKEDGEHQKLGLEFSLDLDNVKDVSNPYDIVKVNGSVNVDLDNLLDLSQYQISTSEEEFLQPNLSRGQISDSDIYQEIKKVGFNLQLDLLGKNDTEYANLDLVFANGEGFLRFNEQADKSAVMKLNIETETMNYILDKVPELISQLSDKETNTIDTLSKFLSEELVTSIKDGDYSFILDMIDKLANDDSGFELGIDMSKLGIGEKAYLDIRIDNDSNYPNIDAIISDDSLTDEQKEELLNAIGSQANASGLAINLSDIAFGNFALNASVNSAPFSDVDLGNKADYQSVKFIPDVVDQITDFVDTKKTGFVISGDMKNSDGLGIDFSGQGQLDNNAEVKEGYGTMLINEYKYHANERWAQHKLAVNVTNLEENIVKTYDEEGNVLTRKNNNLALFVYGDPNGKCVKGKMQLQTFADIFDIIKTFISDYGDDAKYTKFLAPITQLLGMSSLGEIIESKDYVRLASNQLIKEISVINNGGGIRVVISKILLGLPSDITIEIDFNGNNETGNQTLKSLHIRDLALSDKADAKKLNLTFTDYDENMVDIVRKNDTYMNLDGIKTLLDLGINTTKVNFYHLSASAHVKTILGIDIELSGINFYIYVDGVKAKVYGKINSVPTIPFVTTDVNDELFTGEKPMSVELSFETYDDNQDNKVGGIFNIQRVLKDEKTKVVTTSSFPWIKTVKYNACKAYHYRSDSGNFLDQIATYLLSGMIGIKESAVNSILGSSTTSSSEKEAGDFTNTFTSTGFSCTTVGTGLDTVHTIKLGLNLNELTGINALKELEATIKSTRLSYQGNSEGMDILSSLNATLRINFAVDINVSFNANMVEAKVLHEDALARWNATGASPLAALSGNINGVVINENSPYYNNPSNPYTYSYEEIIG